MKMLLATAIVLCLSLWAYNLQLGDLLLVCVLLCVGLSSIALLQLRSIRKKLMRLLELDGAQSDASLQQSSFAAASLHELFDCLCFRLNNLNWETQALKSSTLLTQVADENTTLQSDLSFEVKSLKEIHLLFRAKMAALLFMSPGRVIEPEVFVSGIESARLQQSLKRAFSEYFMGRSDPSTATIDIDLQSSALSALHAFDLRYFICAPLLSNQRLGLLVLGYPSTQPPLQSEQGLLQNCAAKLGQALLSSKHIQTLSGKVAEAEKVDKQKNEFIAHMSHDIRSPLNNIQSILTLLRLEGFGAETPQMLDVALSNCRTLAGLVEDILDYSRHRAGKLEARIREFNLIDVLHEVAESFVLAARNKGLRLQVQTDRFELQVRADLRHIKRIIYNLVSNAIKYTTEGIVLLQVANIHEGRCSIIVSDSGMGMDSDQLSRIFTPFTSFASKEQQGDLSGVGLGLALSQVLARLNDAELSARSVLGRGSEFELNLPLSAGACAVPALGMVA